MFSDLNKVEGNKANDEEKEEHTLKLSMEFQLEARW